MNKSANNQKPELILKRVNGKGKFSPSFIGECSDYGVSIDLINSAVGANADKEKRIALDTLHQFICVKRKNAWTKSYEPLMKRHLELCVDLKDHLTAKDGLHQYRNLCMLHDPSSLESVIIHLMDLSESRTAGAKQKADKVSVAAANRVADLDQEESPESIMLSSMTVEGVKERTDREVVIPWLRFLWENFRAILDLLSRLPKLEKVYHRICEKAFKFCEEYSRNMEFRRLCEMLRQQLVNLQKTTMTTTIAGRFVKAPSEWTAESTEFHLQTRFAQLEVATKFELWNEAFRTIEDINGIIAFSKKTPKARLMVTYYEKLTRIFSVAGNKLFHAYACFKLYQWTIEARKDIRPEEKALMASTVVLAALAVPSISDTVTATVNVEEEEVQVQDKSSQLATLLDFQANPSRSLLLYEIANLGLIDEVLPELKSLYEAFEVKFMPLKFIPTILPALSLIRGNATLKHYADQLEKIAIIRVVQQLSKVYNTVKLEFVYKIFTGLQSFSVVQIEKLLLEAVANKQLNLKISHGQGTVTFKTATSSAVAIDTQVAKLGIALNKVARVIDSVTPEGSAQQKSLNRRVYITSIAENEESEFLAYADRKVLIECRKEELERLQQEKAKELQRQKELQEARRIQDEIDRREEESRKRQQEQVRKEQEKREVARISIELSKYGITKTEAELLELDADSRIQLVVDAQNEQLKQKEEEKKKALNHAKQLDYAARAQRIESVPVVEARQAKEQKEDQDLYDLRLSLVTEEWTVKHTKDLEQKRRLQYIQAHREAFEEAFLRKQTEDYERQINSMRKKLIAEKREQRLTAARRKAYEEALREEEERIREEQRIENERLERERYEALRRQREEEEEKERQREEERRRQEEERQRKAAEEKKRQEEEAAARAAANKGKLDPFGRPYGAAEERPAPSTERREIFGAAKPREERAERSDPFGGARTREEPRRPAAGGADPFDNFRRGQKLPESEPVRRGFGNNSGGFDNFKRGDRPTREETQGDGEDKEAPRAAGGATGSRYVPPSARGSGTGRDEPRGGSDRFLDRKDSGRGGGFGDRRQPDSRPPERKPDNRSNDASSWR